MKKVTFLFALLCASTMMFAETAVMKYAGSTTSNMTEGNNAAIVSLDETLFTVLADKGGNDNLPGLNKAGDFRLYANRADGNGNIITVAINEGVINSIKIDFKQEGTLTVKVGDEVVTGTAGAYTINAAQFSMQNTQLGGESNVQVQINSIEIDYTAKAPREEIVFTAKSAKGTLNDSVFATANLSLRVIDTDSKIEIDENVAKFGEPEDFTEYFYRLKVGGKSSAKNNMKLTVAKEGIVYVAVRTSSSSATDRNLVAVQNGDTIFNELILESAKTVVPITDSTSYNVFPYVLFPVAAGDVAITYPAGALNFYSLGFEEVAAPALEPATYYGVEAFTTEGTVIDPAQWTAVEWNITRNADKTLSFVAEWTEPVTGMVAQINLGDGFKDMALEGQKATYNTTATYEDGVALEGAFFYFPYAGAAKRIDIVYTVGASNEKPATPEKPVVVPTADARIYAYGLKVEKDGDNYKFSYNANIDGTEANIVFYNNGEEAGKVAVDAPKKGENIAVIAPADIPEGEMTWAVELKANPVKEFTKLFEGQDLKKCHLTIDNSPESDYFGRMYIANRSGSGTGGIYVYNQDFTLAAEDIMAGQPKWQSIGRPAVGADGTVYIADWGDSHGGIYVMDPFTLKADSFFIGTQDGVGLWTNAEGVAMGSSTAAVGVYGEGASTVLYAMNEDVPADNSLYQHGVNVYQIGQADGSILRTWDKAPTLAFPLQENAAQMFVINANEHGAFFSCSRAKPNNAAGARSLQFYNVKGERTYVALPEGETADLTGSLGGGCAVSRDLSELVIVDGDGNILVYSVTWTDDTPALTFVTKYETAFAALGSISFDYAGNIIVTAGANYNNSTANHLVAYGAPTDNNEVVVPAKKALTVVGTKAMTKLTEPDAAAPVPTWPEAQVKAMYSPTYNADMVFAEWGSGTQYTQDTYGKKYVTTDLGYFGTEGFELNCLNMEYLHYDIWIAEDAKIRIVPIWGGAEQGVYVDLKGQQWNSIDIAKEQYDQITNWGRVWQVKIDEARNLTLWIGNAYFYRTTELVDSEAPANVAAEMNEAYYFTASLKMKATDNSGAVNFTIYNGEEELAKTAGASDADVYITISNLNAGTEYNFSVVASDDNNNKAEAVAVAVKTLDAPAPAPAPTAAAEDVISIFSDVYTPATWFNLGGWGQSTVITRGAIAEGDTVYFLYNANYMGWELNNNVAAFDATDYYAVHMDIYPIEGTSIGFTPIWGAEAATTKPLEAGKWNSVDFEFSLYNGINLANIYQLKWDWMPAKMFLDNVYIYKQVGDGVDDITVKKDVQKVLENGIIYIIRDGVRYNVMGMQVK